MLLILDYTIVHQCIVIIRKKDILVQDEGPTQGLDDTKITAETKYSINVPKSHKNLAFLSYFNGSNSFLFVNVTKIY